MNPFFYNYFQYTQYYTKLENVRDTRAHIKVWNLLVMMTQSYVDNLGDNINHYIAEKLGQGDWLRQVHRSIGS